MEDYAFLLRLFLPPVYLLASSGLTQIPLKISGQP